MTIDTEGKRELSEIAVIDSQGKLIYEAFTEDHPNNRVDTPFQDHIDLQAVYHSEYEILKSIINDIKCDPNQQSKGAVVIGEAGAGKTHLMMRLAKERLKTNRLLFRL